MNRLNYPPTRINFSGLAVSDDRVNLKIIHFAAMPKNSQSNKDHIVIDFYGINTLPTNISQKIFHLQVESILPLDDSSAHSFKIPKPNKTALSGSEDIFTSSKFVLSPNYMVTELVQKAQDIFYDYEPASMFGCRKENTQNIVLNVEGNLFAIEELESATLKLKLDDRDARCDLVVGSEGEYQTISFNTQTINIRFLGKLQ